MNARKFVVFDALVRVVKWPFLAFAFFLCLFASQPAWAGTITIVKDAQPNDAQDFAFYAFGPNSGCCNPFQLDDDAGAVGANSILSNSKTWTLAAGSYSIKEDFANPVPVTGWILASITCLPAGSATVDMPSKSFTANLTATGHITCTFVDKKATGTVTLKKVLVPATDTGKFTLQLKNGSGTLLANFLNGGNGAVMGPVTVPTGNYNVSEVGGSNGTNLSNYTSVVSGVGCASNGAVSVAAGDNKVCTITNTRIALGCTGWPLVADVYIYNPMTPFGPQTVNICRGGHVVFHNVNSGAAWNIVYISGPTTFPPVPLPTNGSIGSTIPFPTAGNEDYQINGTPSVVVHGHIIIH